MRLHPRTTPVRLTDYVIERTSVTFRTLNPPCRTWQHRGDFVEGRPMNTLDGLVTITVPRVRFLEHA
jgi:hypothetical protein